MDIRERAWFGVHDRLPDGWRVGPAIEHPHTRRCAVSAMSPRYRGRGIPPAVVVGHGEDEIAALTDLSIKLDELRAIEQRMALEEKARAAYDHGAEERSRATLGRPLTPERTRARDCAVPDRAGPTVMPPVPGRVG